MTYCTLNDSLTNARYKFSGWKFKTNKECADEYNASRNHEVAELRAENARLRAALKPVLECPSERPCFVMPDCPRSLAMKEARRIYNEGEAEEQEGGAR